VKSDVLITRASAVILALLGLLPIANWLPGGEIDPAYSQRMLEWVNGTLICLGVAVVTIVLRGQRPSGMTHEDPAVHSHGTDTRFLVALSLASFLLYSIVAVFVFSGHPLLIDEIVQVMQAHIFAEGKLSLLVATHREFFSGLHVVDIGDRVYSQFPPGGPAMLALGELAGATWVVGPLCGAISVALFSRIIRFTDPGASPWFHRGTTLLFAMAPFGAFMFGSHMNHVTALMFILVAVWGLASGEGQARHKPTYGFITGIGLGAAATIRPLDALAFALPACVWLTARAVRDRKELGTLLASGVGILLPFSAMMWVNAQTTGSPLLFGYEVLWGRAHGLGFHTAPWGAAHTPARGLELLSLYTTRMQTYLFETPFPALLPAIAALSFSFSLRAIDRYLLASAALLGALYFAYWHDGYFLGPRFMFPWLPVLVLWTARLPGLMRARFGAGRVWTGVNAALISGAALSATISVPVRIAQYRGGLTSMRVDYSEEARRAGVRNALVFVRESWGAQLVTGLWAHGVTRSAAAALYHNVDACVLDRALRELERDGLSGQAAERWLAPLQRDSSSVRSSPLSPDSTEKMLAGTKYDGACVARINEDRAGYAHLAPLLLERRSGNVYARDLHARDSLLLAEHPERPVYLFRRKGTADDVAFEWLPLARDSLYATWRTGKP
jgi:hypothetical protein